MSRFWQAALLLATAAITPSCATDADPAARRSGLIFVCGKTFAVDAPVVTYQEIGSYDATLESCHFDPERVLPTVPSEGCNVPRRYGVRSTRGLNPETAARVAATGWDLAALQERVHQFVLHFDVCVTSERCFKVLQDVRGLSVHFMLDVDGTIHQTLDLEHRARHAGTANDFSVGIEIAHIGCYPPKDRAKWVKYYVPIGDYWQLEIPLSLGPPPGGPFLTARPGVFTGTINGGHYEMPDYTEAQYRSLRALIDTLVTVFPRLKRDAPRDAGGAVLDRAMDDATLRAYEGLLGHYHVTKAKNDPGPGLDWDRILAD